MTFTHTTRSRRGTGSGVLFAVIVAGVAFAGPTGGVASAATVAVDSDGHIQFVAAAGEVNDVTTPIEPTVGLVIRDDGAPLAAGAGCTSVDAHAAACPGSSGGTMTLGDLDDHAAVGRLWWDVDGAAGDDVLAFVDSAGFRLRGGSGDDTLTGGDNGGSVNSNFLQGGPGDDALNGGPAPETLDGGPGADLIDGGGDPEQDRVDYSARTAPLSVDNDGATGDDGEAGEGDTVTGSVDWIVGGSGDDVLSGSAAPFEQLTGNAGDDVLDGGMSTDMLDGGLGFDVADYSSRTSALRVDLEQRSGGQADEQDVIVPGVEAIWGGSGSDTLIGDVRSNGLYGGLGADSLLGHEGVDFVDYSGYTSPVRVDLDGQAGDDGMVGEGDTVAADVEEVIGGEGADVLTGNHEENALFGSAGNDILLGGGAFDLLSGETGDDTIDSRDGRTDSVACGFGDDSVDGDLNDEVEPDCETVQRPADSPDPPAPEANPPAAPGSPLAPTLAPVDRAGPVVSITSARRVKLRSALARGVRAVVRCSEQCTMRLELRLDAPTARRLRVSRVAGFTVRRLSSNRRVAVVIALTPRARRALRSRRTAALTMRATATDAAGNNTRRSRRILLSR